MYTVIFKIIFICIFASVMSLIIRNSIPPLAPMITVSAGVICFCIIIPYVKAGLNSVNELASNAEEVHECVKTAFKVIAVSVLCEFASQICVDADESYLASKINFAGKAVIICISVPLISSLINNVADMISAL